tara:strand:- start:647 stop:1279 length:633 start_codon:yes stop_codon:yes gene_type:complete
MNISEKIKNTRFLIFDFDGTIANTSPIHEKAFKEVLRPYKLDFKYEEIAGQSTRKAFNHIFKKNNINLASTLLDSLISRKQEIVRENISSNSKFKPLPFAREFIQKYHHNYSMGIASSGSRKTIEIALRRLELYDFFKIILCAEDVLESKPSPEIFLKIISIGNFTKDECLIFEDSQNGFKASKAANIPFIDVTIYPFKKILEEFRNFHG